MFKMIKLHSIIHRCLKKANPETKRMRITVYIFRIQKCLKIYTCILAILTKRQALCYFKDVQKLMTLQLCMFTEILFLR